MSAVPRSVPWAQPMSARDVEPVIAIEAAIYEFPWTPGNFRDSLAAGYSCWTYRQDDALIGYAVMMLAPGEAHLLNLSVAAARQREGHGSALLRHLMKVAREYGARALLLEVRPSNLGARQLYAGFGFEQVGVRRGYYPARHGREDALLLNLRLA
jgi:ribosomal-protein-alanine N-acetyltransferase